MDENEKMDPKIIQGLFEQGVRVQIDLGTLPRKVTSKMYWNCI
jgi:hypothetical protein